MLAVDGGDGYEDVGSDPLAAVVEGGDDPLADVVEGVEDPLAEFVVASTFTDWAALGFEDAAGVPPTARAVTGSTAIRVPGQEGPAAFRLPAPLSLDALVRIGRSGLERAIGGGVADEGDLTARVLIAEAQGDGPVGALTPRPSAPIIERLGIKISGGTVTVAVQDIERSSWRTQRADIDLLVQGLDAAAAEVDAARGLVQVRLLEPALRQRLFGLSILGAAVAAQAQTAQARGGATGTLPGDRSVEDVLILLSAAGIASDKIVRFIHSDARIAQAALQTIQDEINGVVRSLSTVDGTGLVLRQLDQARIAAVMRGSQPSPRRSATPIRADEAVPLIVLYGMLGARGHDGFPLSSNLARAVDVFVARHARVPHTSIARIVTEQLRQLAVDLRAAPPQVRRREEPTSLPQPDPLRVDAGAAAHGDAEGGDGQADSGASPE